MSAVVPHLYNVFVTNAGATYPRRYGVAFAKLSPQPALRVYDADTNTLKYTVNMSPAATDPSKDYVFYRITTAGAAPYSTNFYVKYTDADGVEQQTNTVAVQNSITPDIFVNKYPLITGPVSGKYRFTFDMPAGALADISGTMYALIQGAKNATLPPTEVLNVTYDASTLYFESTNSYAGSGFLVFFSDSARNTTTYGATYFGSLAGAPTIGVATVSGDVASVAFTPNAGQGGARVTSYTVTSSIGSYTATGSSSPITVSGLAPGDYTFTVVANNFYGASPSSAASNSITVVAPPIASGVPCFLGNARVLTPSGYRRMDSLKAGDSVVTPEGTEAAIERVKVTQCAAGPNTSPYVIPAGMFGASHRLLISPDHKVCLDDGRRVEAKKLGLEQEDREGTLTYYNLALAGQADMVVGGVAVESLAPVRRVVMSLADFEAGIKRRYGNLSASVLANIKRTCRLVGPNAIECPVMRR